MKQTEHILSALLAPWAILPEMYGQMLAIFDRWARGEKLTVDLRAEIEAAIGKKLENERARYAVTPEGVAVIPVQGVISKRMDMMTDISGGVSTQAVSDDFREALGRADVKAILFDVDSPGGAVDGTMELAQEIFQARGQKPLATLGDGLMASAAMWIGAAADEVYLTAETGQAGSIGVITVHSDYSKMYERWGVDNTVLSAGKYKGVGNRYEPLTKEGKQVIQDELDYIYSLFVNDIAASRGTSAEDVLERMADGRIFTGSQAVKAGLIDGIKSRGEVIKGLLARAAAPGKSLGKMGNTVTMNGASAQKPGNVAQKEGGRKMTLEELRAQHPELVSALITEGKALGITEGRAAGIEEGKSLGATAERERIQAVLNCSIKGHEDLIKKLAFDGKTTSGEAALQVLAAEQAARDRTRKALETEAPDPAAASASSEQREAEQRAEEAKEGEPKWRAEFEKSEDLKAEFQTVERYLAFKNAEASGKARILRK